MRKGEVMDIAEGRKSAAKSTAKTPAKRRTAAKRKDEETASGTVVARGRGGKYNFPAAVPPENPEDVRRVLSECMYWYGKGKQRAQTNEEIMERTEEFFSYCINQGERATWEKYCLALGYARNTVFEWSNGLHCDAERSNIIKLAKDILASYDAGMAIEGKMNPVPYIFRSKNYYGMKDTQDVVITPNNPLGEETDPNAIAVKYAALPEE